MAHFDSVTKRSAQRRRLAVRCRALFSIIDATNNGFVFYDSDNKRN